MEKLIKSDGIKIVLSSNTTPYNQAAATVAERYEAYFHINTSWIDDASPDGSFPGFIGGMNLKWSSDVFESAGESGKAAIGGAQALPAADQPKIFAVMTENNPDGVGFGDATKGGLEAAGYTVALVREVRRGQQGLLLDHPEVQGGQCRRGRLPDLARRRHHVRQADEGGRTGRPSSCSGTRASGRSSS